MLMARHTAGHKHLHRKSKKTAFDYVVYFFMIATPLFELPQAWNIYTHRSAGAVSISTWGFFALASVVWATYAIREKLLPVFVTSALYVVIELTIVVGIIRYS